MDVLKNKFQIVIARYNENINWLLPYRDITIIYNKGDYNPILNKFQTIYLENVGRESHTYIYHIVNNYDNLAERTLFFQGNISDHKMLDIEDYFKNDNFIGQFNEITIKDLSHNINHYGKYKKDYLSGNMKKCNFTPYDWIKKVIGIDITMNLSENSVDKELFSEISMKENTDINRNANEGISLFSEMSMKENTQKPLYVVWGANFSLSKELILSKPKEFYQNILRYIDYHQNLEEGHYLERTWHIIFNFPYIHKSKIYYLFFNNYEKINDLKKILYTKQNKYNNEIHLWMPILANYEYGIENKISFIKSNNKYILINPYIVINEDIEESYFYIDMKGENNVYILIEFENKNIEELTIKYEIILCSNIAYNKSNITESNGNKIIQLFNKKKENLIESSKMNMKNKITRYHFNISNKIIIKKDLELLFDVENISKNLNIKNIKIKSLHTDIHLDYKMNNEILKDNIKIYLCNNIYDNIKLFYTNNYYENYIEKIDLLSLVSEET
jgi:hypothetical protein